MKFSRFILPVTAFLAAVAAVALGVHLFVVFYEEPTLRRKFGSAYDEYRNNVRRWSPRLHPWSQHTDSVLP